MADIGNNPATPGSSRTFNSNCKGISIPSFPEAGTGVSISGYIEGISGANVRAFIIDPADGTTVLAQSDIRTNIGAAGYYTFTGGSLNGFVLTASAAYYICIGTENAASGLFYFQSGTEVYDGLTSNAGISSVNPLTFISGGMAPETIRDYACYLTYTPGGGPPPPTGLPFVTIIGAKRI